MQFFPTPLEQFEIIPIIPIKFGIIDVSITNQLLIFIIIFIFTTFIINTSVNFIKGEQSIALISNNVIVNILHGFYDMVYSLVMDNIQHKDALKYLPIIFFVFFFIVSMNLIGLQPYMFTITSHIAVTVAFSIAMFIGVNIIGIRTNGIRILELFLPAGTSFQLSFLLVPIEMISYIFKPISLSIRLFANMMAGHTLLKVIAGFATTLMNNSGIILLLHIVPTILVFILFFLEGAVALIQAFVFSMLVSIYINDALNLH